MMMSEALADVDFANVRGLGNALLDQINRVREQDPIFWSPKQQAWIVGGHEEVVEGFKGELPLSNNRMTKVYRFIPEEMRAKHIPTLMRIYPHQLVGLDPPKQTRMRRLLMPAFGRAGTEALRGYVQETINDLLDRAKTLGSFEFIEHVARPLPGSVILKLMGMDVRYLDKLNYWNWAVISGLAGGGTTVEILGQTERAFIEMETVFRGEIDQRRASPGTDFISVLVTTKVGDEQLTDDEIVATCIMTLIAGNETTLNTIALSTVALSQNPKLWGELRAQPERILENVMEMMRYIAMSTTQSRVVAKDFTWRGRELKEGQLVYLMIAGANRDPNVFQDPERIDFSRDQSNNMTFAPGLHMCIGHLLAKMELTEFFTAFVNRFDGVEVLDETLDWGTALGFRGLNTLNVRLF